MHLTHANTSIFLTLPLPWSNAIITAHTVSAGLTDETLQISLVSNIRRRRSRGSPSPPPPPPPLCQRHFRALNLLISVQWNDDIRSLILEKNRAVQTEWEDRIRDGAIACIATHRQWELMIAHSIYFIKRRETQQTDRTRGGSWVIFLPY